MQDVCPIHNIECFTHVMIRDQHTDTAFAQMRDQFTYFADRDRIDTGQRFVEQHELRARRQRAGDFDAAALAARQSQRRRAAQMKIEASWGR